MNHSLLAYGLALALGAVAVTIAVDGRQSPIYTRILASRQLPEQPVSIDEEPPVATYCGTEPAFAIDPDAELTAEWYFYGDCSGNYGPIPGLLEHAHE